MKAYKRADFIKLPEMTVYSRIDETSGELMYGLFCKMSGDDSYDWIEQDLIAEAGFPNNINEGLDAIEYQLNLRDTYQRFETDLNCSGRDGFFDDSDRFVVWDKSDVIKLRDFLNKALLSS